MSSFSPVASGSPNLVARGAGATTASGRSSPLAAPKSATLTPEARASVSHLNGGGRLTPPWKFQQAAALLRSAGASPVPLVGSRWASPEAQRSLVRSHYNPEEVLSSRVRELVAVDNAFARWRALPSPLGPVDGLLDGAVNGLVAKRKGDFAQAAARLDFAAERLASALQVNGEKPPYVAMFQPDGSPDPTLLNRIAQPAAIERAHEYRSAQQGLTEAMDRLSSLSDLLDKQNRSGKVNPWELLRELPGLRPALMNLLRP
jgi:hypothetical protein